MAKIGYLDFELRIEHLEEGYRARVVDCPAGQASTAFEVPVSALELENFWLRMSRPRQGVRRIDSPEMQVAKDFGARLFDAIFDDEVRACLRSSLDEAERQGKGLRFRLHLADTPELVNMPWEYLYHSSLNRFFSLSVETPLVRYLALPERIRPLAVQPPLRVLVMISSPSDYAALDVEAEWVRLREALGDLERRGLVALRRLPRATLVDLQYALRQDEYHIFHFVGHGSFDERTQDGLLLLEDEQGRGRAVSGQDLGMLLHDHRSLRLAILNACEGARTSSSDLFAGTAQSLVQQRIPAVIAMQCEVSDWAAITLAQEFYSALADGYPVDGALAEARKAVFAQGNDVEWGMPVLYMRAPDGVLFDVHSQPVPEQAVARPLPEQPQPLPFQPIPGPTGARTKPSGTRKKRLFLSVSVMLIVAALAVAAILFWPEVSAVLRGTAQPAAMLPTTTSAPRIHWFRIVPTEVRQGDSVAIEWNVSGASAVTILPDVGEDLPPQGDLRHVPGASTVYRLVLPDGTQREVEVKVDPAPDAPVIAFFEVAPQPAARGQDVVLSWQISGDTTRVELSRGFDTIQGLNPSGELTLSVGETTLFILRAYNGDLLTSQSIQLEVVDPTAALVSTATTAPTATPTSVPPTPTATALPPTPTRDEPTPTPPPTRPPPPTIAPGILYAFEQWGTWTRGDQPYGEFEQSAEQKRSGAYAARLRYDFSAATGEDDFVVFRNVAVMGGEPNTIDAWVYGDESGHFLNLWIEDAERQVWSVHLGQIAFSGWRQLSARIDPDQPWPSGKVFGPDNGQIDYPIRFYGIVLDRPGAGPRTGTIFIDDIATSRSEGTVGQPVATATAASPGAGEIGRIIFTVQVDRSYALYSTDPNWDKAVKIGDTDWDHATCLESNTTAVALDGTTVGLRPIERCPIAGTVGSCPSPNGLYKVNTSNQGSYFSLVLWNVAENKMQEAYFQGALNIYPGINWAPDSSHFLFTVEDSVYRADVGQAGYRRIIPFKHNEYPLQYTPDGAYVYYLKPVNGAISDVFLARPDGSGERNLTNAPISIKLCPRWRR